MITWKKAKEYLGHGKGFGRIPKAVMNEIKILKEKRRLKKVKIEKKEKVLKTALQIINTYNQHYLRCYQISYLEYSQMKEWQNYKCAICQKKENGKKLHVDHDHNTGQVRLLLCRGCNNGTGITDNPVLCKAKSEYLYVYIT